MHTWQIQSMKIAMETRPYFHMQSSFERVAESGFADSKQSKKIRRRKALIANLFAM